MTTANERYRALMMASTFLHDLTDPNITKRVPKEIRAKARRILRHYPWPVDIDAITNLTLKAGTEWLDRTAPEDRAWLF